MKPLTIDLFCRVVDNFGDIGVCWRLARQLVKDQGCGVRLYVDDFTTFARLERGLDPALEVQTINGVTILRWDDAVLDKHYDIPAQAVIEAFACDLPERVVKAMMAAPVPPVWMDLEYLSAEGWVDENHAIISINPSTGLHKTLFFPGFTPKTGGLNREKSLLEEKNTFQSSVMVQNLWRKTHNIPEIDENILDISLFCYDNAPLEASVDDLAQTGRTIRFFAPSGVAKPQIAALKDRLPANIQLHTVPFLTQDDYDRLLWTCDLNFVRGEDSFVRAIWAGRPMIWQIYVQDDNAHLIKLGAFLDRYSENLTPQDTETLAQFTVMWNVGGLEEGALSVAPAFFEILPRLRAHAQNWSQNLATQPDLASQIVRFIQDQIEQNL